MPAAGLIDLARENGAEIIIVNTEETAGMRKIDIQLIGKANSLIPTLLSVG